ncbi:hypothetical protein Tco_0353439 [Tanacetum coccineum]
MLIKAKTLESNVGTLCNSKYPPWKGVVRFVERKSSRHEKKILLDKVLGTSRHRALFTWEREDLIQSKYRHHFSASSSAADRGQLNSGDQSSLRGIDCEIS